MVVLLYLITFSILHKSVYILKYIALSLCIIRSRRMKRQSLTLKLNMKNILNENICHFEILIINKV